MYSFAVTISISSCVSKCFDMGPVEDPLVWVTYFSIAKNILKPLEFISITDGRQNTMGQDFAFSVFATNI